MHAGSNNYKMAPSKDGDSSSCRGVNNYKMVPSKAGESSSWLPTHHTFSSNIRHSRGSPPFKLDKGLLAKRSAKIASLLKDNPCEDLSTTLSETQADPETLELIARFCHGFEVTMTSDNIIPLMCLSHHLQMTEIHSCNNLLSKSLEFFQHQILPSWDQIIRCLRSLVGPALQQAADIGLFDHCLEALVGHALSNPTLLAQPILDDHNTKTSNGTYRLTCTNARRKLFGADHQRTTSSPSEDLTSLHLQIYELVIQAMFARRVSEDHIAGSLYRYLKKHAFQNSVANGQHFCSTSKSNQTHVIETIEQLMPGDVIPCTLLFEIYTHAVSLEASQGCLNGLEARIGKQLDRVTVQDLLALDLDIESLRQMLKGYYGNFTNPDNSGLVAVADLMEGYLMEVAEEKEMEMSAFVAVAEMVTSTMCVGLDRCSDGIYRAVDVFLEKHRELSESEREEVCRVLDFSRMSPEACDHAALNQKLPLRVVVQALFVSQLQLRDNVTKAVGQNFNNSGIVEENEDEEKGQISSREDEEWGDERREIIGRDHEKSCEKKCNKKKVSLWKEVKRKFGCMGSNNTYEALRDCNCQVKKRKKVHPKKFF